MDAACDGDGILLRTSFMRCGPPLPPTTASLLVPGTQQSSRADPRAASCLLLLQRLRARERKPCVVVKQHRHPAIEEDQTVVL